jgi:ubiquitin-protein ligase
LFALFCCLFDSKSSGRSFLLYLDLAGYPARAPEVRFVTPVFHLNVNSDGRICLDCLSTWSEKTTVREILQEIAQLMRTPNPNSPLDSVKGSLVRFSMVF